MNCREFHTAHLEYTDQTLSAERLAAAQRHREECGDCARFDTLVRRSLLLVHNLPPVAPDARRDPRRMARIARQHCASRPRVLLTPSGLVAAAAVAFTAGLLSAPVLLRRPTSTIVTLPAVVALAVEPASSTMPMPMPIAPPNPTFAATPVLAPLMRVDFLTGASGGIPLWTVASLIDDAPARFVSAQLTSTVPAR